MHPAHLATLGARLLRNTWLSPRPYLLYFKPTDRCDCQCRTCDRWQRPSRTHTELSTAEVRAMLTKFRSLGATVLVLWGGEPTLRSDLGAILRAAKELGYRTSMCTNARLLHRRAGEVLPHLDTLLCSLDGFGANHDRQRGVEGLFDRVVQGLKDARGQAGLRVKIWASVHRENVQDLEPLARLAADLGVWVEYFPVARVPGHNDAVVLEREGLREAFDRVLALKRTGYPVWNSERSLVKVRDAHKMRCNFGRVALQVDCAGLVHSCEAPNGTPLYPWGRYDAVDWEKLFRSSEFASAKVELSRCELCRLPCVVELSDGLTAAYAEMFWHGVTRG